MIFLYFGNYRQGNTRTDNAAAESLNNFFSIHLTKNNIKRNIFLIFH